MSDEQEISCLPQPLPAHQAPVTVCEGRHGGLHVFSSPLAISEQVKAVTPVMGLGGSSDLHKWQITHGRYWGGDRVLTSAGL